MYLCIHHHVCRFAFYLGADMHSPEQQDSTSHHLVQPSWDLPVGTSVGPPAQAEHPSPAVQDQAASLPSHAALSSPREMRPVKFPPVVALATAVLMTQRQPAKSRSFSRHFYPHMMHRGGCKLCMDIWAGHYRSSANNRLCGLTSVSKCC